MRLLACQDCHTQYDVSDVQAESFPCRCGSEIRNERLKPVDAAVHRCGSCGAIVSDDAEGCAYCGSQIVRDTRSLSLLCPECYARNEDASRFCTACGVAFRPEAVHVDGYELPCPTCTCLMPPRQIGGVGINECPQCNGLWVPGEHFDHLVSKAVEQSSRPGAVRPAATKPRVQGANPARQQVLYRKCPVCEAFMQRRNYQKTSGVIIDCCREHGTWLDADELEQIAGFILSGGRPSASRTMAGLEAQAESEYRNARRDNIAARYPRTPLTHTSTSRGSSGFSLLGILAELLD